MMPPTAIMRCDWDMYLARRTATTPPTPMAAMSHDDQAEDHARREVHPLVLQLMS